MDNFDYYADHALPLHNKATAAHAEWIAQMDPEELEEAKKLGLTTPPSDSAKVGGHSPDQKKDLAESPRASEEIDIAESLDTLADRIADEHNIPLPAAKSIAAWHSKEIELTAIQHQAEIIQNIVAGLLSAENPKLAAAGVAFATRLDALNGLNQTEFADENNISRQAVSKCVCYWQEILGVPPSVHQKSESAREAYKEAALADHWRNKIFKISNLIKEKTQ